MPNRVELCVLGEFLASHSLVGYELPHFHLWKVAVKFCTVLPLKSDRVVDLVELQQVLDQVLDPIRGQYLNAVLPQVSPTSEMMGQWLWQQIESRLKLPTSAWLSEVSVTLCNPQGVAMGSARIFFDAEHSRGGA